MLSTVCISVYIFILCVFMRMHVYVSCVICHIHKCVVCCVYVFLSAGVGTLSFLLMSWGSETINKSQYLLFIAFILGKQFSSMIHAFQVTDPVGILAWQLRFLCWLFLVKTYR